MFESIDSSRRGFILQTVKAQGWCGATTTFLCKCVSVPRQLQLRVKLASGSPVKRTWWPEGGLWSTVLPANALRPCWPRPPVVIGKTRAFHSSHEHHTSLVRWRLRNCDPRPPACFCLCQSKFLDCIWSLVTNPGRGLLGVGGFHLLGPKTGFAEASGLAGYLPRLASQSWSEWCLFWAQRWGSRQDVLGVKPHSPAVPTRQPCCYWPLALCNPPPSLPGAPRV